MALGYAALADLRDFVKRRVGYLQYRAGSVIGKVPITDAQVLSDGTVRIQAMISPGSADRISRVEIYNNNGDLWAHQDVNITIDRGQMGVLYWFDFTIKEGS